MTSRPVRVATYHRVSSLDGRQNTALAREELRAAAERLGAIAMEVEERGSGAKNDRPGLQRVLAAARKGAVDVVVVWKLDRFGRSAVDVLANIRELTGRGVRFLATSQNIDARPGGDAVSSLTLTVLAAVAEFERELIRERVTLGLRHAAKNGTRSGRAIGRPRTLDKGKAAEVKRLRAAGRSWAKVAGEVGCTVASARRAAAR